jgi:spermidine synthase
VPGEPEILERVTTPRGELVLRRVDGHLEVISNGVFLMDTRDGRSERALVREALRLHPAPRRLLVGGLGVGFSLLEAVAATDVQRIVVVEIEPVLVDWHAAHLLDRTGSALADPRVTVAVADVLEHLAARPAAYDVVCLDVDNGPDWTVPESNAELYGEQGLGLCLAALAPGGVLAVWSASPSPAYERRLRDHLADVRVIEIAPLIERGEPDVVYLGMRPGEP